MRRSTPTKARSRTLIDLRLGNAGRLSTGGVYEDTKEENGGMAATMRYCGRGGRGGIRGPRGSIERKTVCRRLEIVLRCG